MDPADAFAGAFGEMMRTAVKDAVRAELRPLVEKVDALARLAPPAFISVSEAARIMKRCPTTIRRACEAGELAARRVGRSWQIDAASLRPPSAEAIAQLAAEARATAR